MRVVLCFTLLMSGCLPSEQLAGCDAPDQTARANLIARILRKDNQQYLHRSPDLVATKFEKMSIDTYDWMRGSAALWYFDVQNLSRPRTGFDMLTTSRERTTLLIGDAHPENLSTMFTKGSVFTDELPALSLNWIDLDNATAGPFILDLQRALLGLYLFVGGSMHCDQNCVTELIEAFVDQYLNTTYAIEQNETVQAPPPGRLLSSLANEAQREGAARHRLHKHTEVTNGRLKLKTVGDDESGDKVLRPLSPLDQAYVAQIADQLQSFDPSIIVLDSARRFGQGVSSLPALRYILLIRSSKSREPLLLNIREVFDPPNLENGHPDNPLFTRNNAERLLLAQKNIWAWGDADPFAAAFMVGKQAFRVLTWSSYLQSLDHQKIDALTAQGKLDQQELNSLARYIAFVLATAHERGGYWVSGDTDGGLYNAVQTSRSGLVSSLIETVLNDAARAETDRQLLQCLINNFGPLAGTYEGKEFLQ